MTLPCLCLVTAKKILGINICNLKRVGVTDWVRLPSPPLDFSLEIPRSKNPPPYDIPDTIMAPFMLDSKIYVAGGSPELEHSPCHWNPCDKIYEFDVKKKEITMAESIVEPPTVMAESIIASIAGDAYFLVCSRENTLGKRGLWVLRRGSGSGSCSKHWEVLTLPFDVEFLDWNTTTTSFVLRDQIFLQASINEEACLYSFDPQSQTWKDEPNAMMKSFDLPEVDYCFPTASVCVEGVSSHNTTVMLSWMSLDPESSSSRPSSPDGCADMMIYALLVNDKGVIFYHPFEEWFARNQPNFLDGCRSAIVDLGNGMVCALVCGHAVEHGAPVLCVSVFTVTKHDDIEIDTHAAPPPQQKFFFSASVLRMGAFTMDGCIQESDSLLNAFICPQDPDAILDGMFASTMRLDLTKVPKEWYRRPEEAAGTSSVENEYHL